MLLRQIFLSKPDKAYAEWLSPQLRSALMNGQVFLFLTFTPISWVGYFYYYADYVKGLPMPEKMVFGIGDFYRMLAVPSINLAFILFIKSRPQVSNALLEKLMLISIGLVASSMVSTSVTQTYYNAEFYAFEIIVLIVFTQILLGLTFRKSVKYSFLLSCSAFFYLLIDHVNLTIKVYDTTFIITVWGPVLFGALMLEQSRRFNFMTISQLEATSKELRLKNEDLQQFAYASSHDLQEPLRSISNFVNVLDKRLDGQLSAEQKTYFGIIRTSTERMQNLIRAILEYSRIGRNKTLETIQTDEVLGEVLGYLSFAIQNSGANIEAETLPNVRGYRLEFSMLLQNLIGNALKFRRPGVPPIIKIRAAAENGSFLFSIADNGIGIEEQYSQKIFHLFSRLHSREEFEGTGIGLTHCKKIVELHGGKIWLKSAPNEGTTFFFTIPRDIFKSIYEKEIALHHAH